MVLPRIPQNFGAIHLFSELDLYLFYNLLGYTQGYLHTYLS